jgi:hypothetical protein
LWLDFDMSRIINQDEEDVQQPPDMTAAAD